MSTDLAIKILRDFIRLNNLRYTPQREIILKYFLDTEGHVGAEELYEKIRKKHPEIGIATVRRSLNLFVECKIANKTKFYENQTVYEPRRGHHDHFICLDCGEIIEFHDPEIEKRQKEMAKKYNFQIHFHKLEIYGYCSECRTE